jgi:hypothetical protein
MKIIVIGAGIFGVTTALSLSENEYDVTLVESEEDIMDKASKCNHNRLHFGFHYPRSKDTAKQSLDGYDLFYKIFSSSTISNFPNYYLNEKNSKVSDNDYKIFCDNLNLYYKESTPKNIEINKDNISFCAITNEPIFDFESIKINLKNRLKKSNIKLILNKKIIKKSDLNDFDVVINTTYSNINYINNLFDITPIKLKLQDVIIPIFKMNSEKIGLTIMDGDYCSIMPKGFEKNTFLLYHVKYSVIKEIEDYLIDENWVNNDTNYINEKINEIYKHSEFYYPFLKNCERISYWRTTRALPINTNDERLSTLTINNTENKTIISLLSGKITTCWLMANKIFDIINEKENYINR